MPSIPIFSLLLDNNGSYVTSRVGTQHTVHGAEAQMTFTCRKVPMSTSVTRILERGYDARNNSLVENPPKPPHPSNTGRMSNIWYIKNSHHRSKQNDSDATPVNNQCIR
ncbi:hypothetical protein BOTCAL_0244g00220 [Botryotinia calthae]|uniref:Uncharacterized protein n=1 Tax=Botryotinia calthae TaxID=38488 RepID=A0A4Y8CWX3_9HELO|nr:hypothetical protein BOTCAL_0244g00220 [Botryotinia calthae]